MQQPADWRQHLAGTLDEVLAEKCLSGFKFSLKRANPIVCLLVIHLIERGLILIVKVSRRRRWID